MQIIQKKRDRERDSIREASRGQSLGGRTGTNLFIFCKSSWSIKTTILKIMNILMSNLLIMQQVTKLNLKFKWDQDG